MKGYDEIRDIIVNRLGLHDQASYKSYCDEFIRPEGPRIPTPDEIELLSPDAIDNNAFWRVAEELFQTDPVSNCNHGVPVSPEEANHRNLSIYHLDGFTGLIEAIKLFVSTPMRVLEIGPGYGGFKHWLANSAPEWIYHAADVYPRIEGVDAALLNGCLSDETKARTYDVAIASNVFQHLSVVQRRAYYADIAASLSDNGSFMVSMFVDCLTEKSWGRDPEGRFWMRHYGQFTEIQTHPAVAADLQKHFIVDASLVRENKWAVFRCRKKAPV